MYMLLKILEKIKTKYTPMFFKKCTEKILNKQKGSYCLDNKNLQEST